MIPMIRQCSVAAEFSTDQNKGRRSEKTSIEEKIWEQCIFINKEPITFRASKGGEQNLKKTMKVAFARRTQYNSNGLRIST